MQADDDAWHFVTLFPDQYASRKTEEEFTLEGLADEIRDMSRPKREALPWLKLARFGDTPNKNNCLRTNKNVLKISGVEAEHDAGTVSFETALGLLRAARIRCLIYTSPSYRKGEKERWRVLAPLSKELDPKIRTDLVACLNGVLDGAATGESFTLSLSFYYGRVGDNPDHRVEVVEGNYIDLRTDLTKRFKNQKPKKERRAGPAPAATAVDRAEVEAALAVIPSACSYEKWLRVGAALWHQFGPGGFDLFDAWSSTAEGFNHKGEAIYTPESTAKQWDGIQGMTDITIGTLFHLANEADPTWRKRYHDAVAAKVGEQLKSLLPPDETELPPPRPADGDPFSRQTEWLRLTHGYCALDDKVIELYEDSNTCQLSREAFAFTFQSWSKIERVEGKRKITRAPAAWGWHPGRITVRGVRMRPDQPFPLYTDQGQQYKNTYRRPRHSTTGGTIAPWLTFMERLVPDPGERGWLFDWMAHKQARPDIPGTAVIFVADNEDEVREGRFGTGRGLLFRIVHQLYGPQYARTQSFNVLDGTSGQSVYTDWMHGSVLVTVDESRTSPTAHRKGERSAVYDVLKDIVDPNPKQMNFKVKHRQSFDAMSYCSFWVATNHADALAIPLKDRRFTVLRNGREILPAEAVEIDAWMTKPENMGALSQWLAQRDLSTFNMRQPLDTVGKAEMADLARSEVEHVLRDFMEDDSRGLVFTRQHLMLHVELNFDAQHDKWRGDFEGVWRKYCTKAISTQTGAQRRVRVGGTQKRLFCFRVRREAAKRLPEVVAAREAGKWGHIDTIEHPLTVLGRGSGTQQKDE